MLRSSENPIQITLLDDHEVVLLGMRGRFDNEPDLKVVSTYMTGRDMINGLRTMPAEVLVLDYSLEPTEIDGINLIQVLKIKYPRSKLLIVSSHDNAATVDLIMRSGVKGFVSKAAEFDELIAAIRTVAAGGTHHYLKVDKAVSLHEPTLQKTVDATLIEPIRTDDVLTPEWSQKKQLSTRKREVLRCCLDGMSVTQIAEKFDRSVKTISTQKRSAFRKLGIITDNELFKIHHQLRLQ